MSSRQQAVSATQRNSGNFEVQLYIRTVETPLAPRPDPAERMNWPRLIVVVAGAFATPLVVAALVMLLKSFFHAR